MARHLFLHIGDMHVGPGPRLQDRLDAIDQIIVWADDQAEAGRLAAILIPGDLFHAKSTIEDRNLLAPRLQRLAARAPIVMVDGNHDAPGDLEILSRLSSGWPIHVVSQPRVLYITCATGVTAAIACLPYPHRAGMVGAGVAHDDLGQVARQLLEPLFAQFAAELEEAERGGAIPLFIGHVNVGGSVSSTGQPQIGREIELDPALLARLGPIYKGLNHIHKHQVIADVVYPGSICRMDFGENEAKGFVVATADTLVQVNAVEWSWKFIPLDVPAQFLVEGDLARDGFRITSVDGNPVDDDFPSSWTGSDVRCRYRYRKSEAGILDQAHIMAEFAGCRSLKLDPLAELEHTVRVPEVAAAVTLTAKAEAYCAHRQIPWTAAMAAKLDALQQQPAEAILAALQAHVATTGQPRAAAAERQVA